VTHLARQVLFQISLDPRVRRLEIERLAFKAVDLASELESKDQELKSLRAQLRTKSQMQVRLLSRTQHLQKVVCIRFLYDATAHGKLLVQHSAFIPYQAREENKSSEGDRTSYPDTSGNDTKLVSLRVQGARACTSAVELPLYARYRLVVRPFDASSVTSSPKLDHLSASAVLALWELSPRRRKNSLYIHAIDGLLRVLFLWQLLCTVLFAVRDSAQSC
jgi:hypothetical protein